MGPRKAPKKKKPVKKRASSSARTAAKTVKKARKKPAREARSDEDILFWVVNHIATYFGDNGDDDGIVAHLRKIFPDYPFVEESFRRGIDLAIKLPARDRKKIVGYYANRRADTAEQTTKWLVTLRDRLFAP